MHRFTRIAALLCVSSMLAACGQSGSVAPASGSNGGGFVPQSVRTGGQKLTPYFLNLPAPKWFSMAKAQADNAAGTSIPFFSGKVKSPLDGNTYNYSLVGADPHTSNVTTNVSYVPIVLRVHFPGGIVLDPTKPGCNDTVSVQNRFYQGPNFVNVPLTSNGINVGKTQINDGDQRAQFWKLVKTHPKWHTILKAAATPKVVDFTPTTGQIVTGGVCSGSNHDLGGVDFGEFDTEVNSLAASFSTSNQVPMVLSYNVVLTSGGCCIIGYHGTRNNNGVTQPYAVGAYTDPGFFSVPIDDIHAWTHEIGELFNDPFLGNATPAWGHVGQVSGCQNNLEVGDPLTGTPFIVNFNGFTYHPQELAFFDWFFRTPAEGTGGEFSFEGTFETSQNTIC